MSKQEAYEQPIVYNRGNVSVPPIVLEFLGLGPEMTAAGKIAIMCGLIYQYGIQFFQYVEVTS